MREQDKHVADAVPNIDSKGALQESELFLRSVLDGLSSNVAIIDENGVILKVNESWRAFARSNGAVPEHVSEGVDYLAVCDRADASGDEEARWFASAIRNVLSGRADTFTMEYPCHSDHEQRWFIGRITPFPGGQKPRAIISHENITRRRRAQERLRRDKERFSTLAHILQYNAPSTQAFLDYALEEAVRFTDSGLGCIFSCDEDSRSFHTLSRSKSVMETYRMPGSEARLCRVYGTDLPGEVLQRREPVVLSGSQTEPGTGARLALPVFSNERIVAVVLLADKPGGYQNIDILQTRLLMEAVWEVLERRRAEEALKRIEWMLTPGHGVIASSERFASSPDTSADDLVSLNTCRLILDAVGSKTLSEIAWEYLDWLETSTAIYEKDGSFALSIMASDWCRFLNRASRAACNTDDEQEALASGSWHCRDSWIKKAVRPALRSGHPVDIACNCGLHVYAVPVFAGGEAVGAICVGYGDPPRTPETLSAVAEHYGVPVEALAAAAESYESRPPYIIEMAKRRVASSARLIGEIIERRQVEQDYQVLFNEMQEGFAVLKVLYDERHIPVDYELLIANPALETLLNLTAAEMVGKTLLTLLPEVNEHWQERLAQVAMTGQSDSGSDHLVLLDRHVRISAFVPAEGQLACVVADISEQVQAQNALRREHDLVIRLIENTPLAIVMTDTDGIVVSCNNQAEQLLGLQKADYEHYGYNAPEWHLTDLEGNPFPEERLPFRRVMDTKRPVYNIQHAIEKQAGERKLLSVTGFPLFDPDGAIEQVVFTIQDITGQKRVENDLFQYQQRLRSLASQLSAAEEQERYRLATYLHDDVGQLQALARIKLGELNTMPLDDSALALVRETREVVSKAIEKTRTIGRDLFPLTLHQFGLAASLEVLTEEITASAGLDVSFEGESDPPPLDVELAALLYRSVRELLFNAVKHAKANHASVGISFNEEAVQIVVQDDGVGFDRQSLQSDFRRGHGFGLFSIEERMRYTGGCLELESAPGQGVRAVLSTPFRKHSEQELNP